MNEHSWRPVRIVAAIVGGIALALVLAFVFGYFVMILWNWLMPEIFGLPRISYWQGWGLILLSHVLLKSGHHHDCRREGPDGHLRRDTWKRRMREKFGKPHLETEPEQEEGIPQGD